jgi:hypothetical protein
MWSPHSAPQSEDHLLVHQFIREFGRRPTDAELARYRREGAAARNRRRLSMRLALGRAVSRL